MNLPPANYWSISRATLKRSLVNLTQLLYALLNQNSISFQNDVVSVQVVSLPGQRMTVSDIQAVLSSARWTDEAFYLKEFVHKHKLPQIAKVLTS